MKIITYLGIIVILSVACFFGYRYLQQINLDEQSTNSSIINTTPTQDTVLNQDTTPTQDTVPTQDNDFEIINCSEFDTSCEAPFMSQYEKARDVLIKETNLNGEVGFYTQLLVSGERYVVLYGRGGAADNDRFYIIDLKEERIIDSYREIDAISDKYSNRSLYLKSCSTTKNVDNRTIVQQQECIGMYVLGTQNFYVLKDSFLPSNQTYRSGLVPKQYSNSYPPQEIATEVDSVTFAIYPNHEVDEREESKQIGQKTFIFSEAILQ